MKVLLTAFNPFAGRSLNAAAETLKHIKRHNISVHEFELVKVELPTEYERSREILKESLLREKPDLVIALGEAAGRNRISLERVAINLNDSKAKDNANYLAQDEKIFKDGQNAYFSNLDLKALEAFLKSKDIPVSISNTAGTYVCNNVFYSLMYFIDKYDLDTKAGFVHLPLIPEEVLDNNYASMSLDLLIKAVNLIIFKCLEDLGSSNE